MLNRNFYPEIVQAGLFVQNHSYDIDLKWFIEELRENESNLTRQEKFDLCRNWLGQYYPNSSPSLALGMVYYSEN